MTRMRRLMMALVVASFVCSSAIVHAQQTVIDLPGAHISAGSGGSAIITNGAEIQTQPTTAMPSVATSLPSNATTSYANATLSGMDFSGKNLSAADFTNANLSGANLSGANLTGATLANANLSGADLTGAVFVHASLVNAQLSGANLTNADFSQADLTNAQLNDALVVNTRFDGAALTNVDMSKVIRQQAARPTFVDARAISSALTIDPAHPNMQRKIDLTVNFDFNSDTLTSDGVKQVREIAAALANSGLSSAHIRVEGHTDNVGGERYNQDLSVRRAERVLKTLTDYYNIPANRLSAVGYGKTRPIASNDNDLGQAMNRRVTLVNIGS